MVQISYGCALFVQLLLLGSTSVIYFRSRLITGLEPQQAIMMHAPADRLVIFVVDGLSTQKFFESGCSNIPQLGNIFLHQGQVGISRPSATNNYRTGDKLLFSGFPENPAALFKSRAFETVFNRSVRSYAWGSAKLLHNFPDIHEAYVHGNDVPDIDIGSYKLDEWAFNGVHKFLNRESQHIKDIRGLVILIHLMGLQESNGIQMYMDNLNYTQHGIWTTYQQFEQALPDHRTAYLLTCNYVRGKLYSSVAMETPFMIWGAGVSNSNSIRGCSFVANKEKKRLPLHVLEQIELTPLMTALLGLSPPINNRGQLPTGFINASQGYESHALLTNSIQLLKQALHLLQQHNRGLFSRYLPKHWLTLKQLDNFIYTGNLLWQQKRFLTLKEYSGNFMPDLLKCIEYYETYYDICMLLATACSYAGWQCLLRYQLPVYDSTQFMGRSKMRISEKWLGVFIIFLFIFIQFQRIPMLTTCVLLLPNLIWMLALQTHDCCPDLPTVMSLLLAICCIVGLFFRRAMSICYIGFAFYNNKKTLAKRSWDSYVWMIIVGILTAISWMPSSLGYWHRNFLLASLVLTFVVQILPRHMQVVYHKNLLVNGIVLLVASIHVLFSPYPWILHFIARAYLAFIFYPRFRQQNIDFIIFNISTAYALLCTSYEALIIHLLAQELLMVFRSRIVKGKSIDQIRTLTRYMLLYSIYTFSIIGKIEDVPRFLGYIHFTGFGYYSTFINGLIIALKLMLPLLLLQCIISANTEIAWTYRAQIFQELLAMCNGMACVLLFRVRIHESLGEMYIRIVQFIVVQVLPFVLLLLTYMAHYLLGDKRKQLDLPQWNVHIL